MSGIWSHMASGKLTCDLFVAAARISSSLGKCIMTDYMNNVCMPLYGIPFSIYIIYRPAQLKCLYVYIMSRQKKAQIVMVRPLGPRKCCGPKKNNQ